MCWWCHDEKLMIWAVLVCNVWAFIIVKYEPINYNWFSSLFTISSSPPDCACMECDCSDIELLSPAPLHDHNIYTKLCRPPVCCDHRDQAFLPEVSRHWTCRSINIIHLIMILYWKKHSCIRIIESMIFTILDHTHGHHRTFGCYNTNRE